MELPSALRWALGLVASIMESMSRSKISGWKTSSTRRRFLSTMTWRPHSCAVVGIGKPQVCTVLDTCLRVAGSTLRSSSTTRWYALTASSSEYREALYQAVSCAPMVYSPSSPRAIQLLGPFLHLVRDGMGGLLGQTHMRGRMRGQDGDLCEVLDGLVCGHAPFLADAMQVAR